MELDYDRYRSLKTYKKVNVLNILCFAGSRAEYYILRPLLLKLAKNKNFKLGLILSGGITKEKNQRTINDIREDKIKIKEIIDIPENYLTHSEKIGFLCLTLTPFIYKFNPELCIVYGDRYESFAFATASTHLNKIILHIEAGDITEGGTYDDYIRHCITKMSHLFCTSTKKGLNIVSRLGEQSWRAIHSGLLSYDDMHLIKEKDQKKVLKELNIIDDLPIVIATLHPIPINIEETKNESRVFFKALFKFSIKNKSHIFITSPNSDNGNQYIANEIKKVIKKMDNTYYYESLGGFRYQTLMSLASSRSVIVCGNSSSIIKEAPFYKAHSLNIGSRQMARESASTQINCKIDEKIIISHLEKLSKFRNVMCINPYYVENASQKVIDFFTRIFQTYSKSDILNKKWNFD